MQLATHHFQELILVDTLNERLGSLPNSVRIAAMQIDRHIELHFFFNATGFIK